MAGLQVSVLMVLKRSNIVELSTARAGIKNLTWGWWGRYKDMVGSQGSEIMRSKIF